MVAESRDGSGGARGAGQGNGQAQARLACDLTGRRPLGGSGSARRTRPHDLAQAGAGHSRADGVMPCGNVDKTSTIGIFLPLTSARMRVAMPALDCHSPSRGALA